MRRDTTLHVTVDADDPVTASARAYLREALPAVYREQPAGTSGQAFVMRFLEALEEVLDPAVAMIDLLPAHLDLALAPPDVIALVGEWLGIELDAALPIGAHRRLLRHAAEISRTRGTLFGLWLVLELAFKGLEFELRDGGGVTASMDPTSSHPAGERTLTVVCPPRLHPDDMAAVRRVVHQVKPVGVRLELLASDGEAA